MRLGFDLSIMRHQYAGTARYAEELLAAMTAVRRSTDEVIPAPGWPRLRRGHHVLRVVNLASDLAWTIVGAPRVVFSRQLDVWYSPANIIPPVLHRPSIVTIHDVNFLLYPEAYDAGYARYAEVMIRMSAHRAAHVITDSEFSRDHLIQAFGLSGDRVSVVYPGLDHTLTADASPTPVPSLPARYALFVGQTEPHKNVGLLLDAWEAGSPADLHLVIAGQPGREHARILERTTRPPLVGRVHILGRVTSGQLETLYARATCFLFPSRAEGFGFPPLEAMARGVPAAVARAGSLPEVTAGAALTFDPDDPLELAARVLEMAADSDARSSLIAEGIKVAGRYRWAAAAEAVWTVAGEACGRAGPSRTMG
jgi:glycosyltransferase involved in cell wall biosynthesis